jgi:hypothetical protein
LPYPSAYFIDCQKSVLHIFFIKKSATHQLASG